MNEKISVIVPVYNVEKYLSRCVESLVNQTYPNMEIILVDDGSPDTCPAWCDLSHHDNPLKIKVIHKENGGAMSARCAGLEAAVGEYVAFVDGDDIVEEDYIEFLVKEIEETGADIAQCGYGTIHDGVTETFATGEKKLLSGADSVREMLKSRIYSPWPMIWAKLIRRELFDGLRLDYGLVIGEDNLAAFLLFLRAKKVAIYDETKYLYRQYPYSVTGRFSNRHVTDMGRFYEIMLETVKKDSELYDELRAERYKYCLYYALYLLYSGEHAVYLDELIREIKRDRNITSEYPELFTKKEKIKAVLLCSNLGITKTFYKLYRDLIVRH